MSIINNPPLQTNRTKKIVFIFAFFASAFFNISLFSSVGYYIHTKLIYGLIGLSTVYFQTLELKNYYNIKKKKKYIHFCFYIICTIASIAGTLGAGWAQIEKLKPALEKTEIDVSNNAINKVLSKSKNLNQWAVINLLNKKKKLKETEQKIKKEEKNIISSLNGISKILKISNEKTGFYFLIFISLILELMIFGSATYNGKLFIFPKLKQKKYKRKKLSKLEKEINAGQNIFTISDFRKVG